MSSSENSTAVIPGRLIGHFRARTRDTQNSGWSDLWDTDQSDLWDRGKPSPALVDFVEKQGDMLPVRHSGRPCRILVPGCGRGYDVVMLALHGFDVWGLEVSETAVKVATAYAETELANPSDDHFGSPEAKSLYKPGKVKFVAGDFFKRDWEKECLVDGWTQFHLIYDYTFLCAILPEMRADWARRMGELLTESGLLVCLEFPLYKDVEAVGPPWGLKGVHWNLLAEGGDGILRGNDQGKRPEENSNGMFERLDYFKPARSYPSGKGTDMVSVWRRKKGIK